MPIANFSEEWADFKWGEGDPLILGPLVDIGGNPITLPANVQFLGWDGDGAESFRKNRIYDFHLKGIRRGDEQGALFWKRFCDGPDRVWETIEQRMDELPTLYNIDNVEDRYLKFLVRTVGWDSKLDSIIDKLDSQSLRRLTATSVALWRRRSVDGGYIEILNAIIGVDAWEWNWFDKRFVLDQTRLGQDQLGADAYFMSVEGRRETNLRIVDAKKTLDRDMITDLVKLWRPSGERVRITFVEFFDRFNDDTKGWKTYNAEVEQPTNDIDNGNMRLLDAGVQHAFPTTDPLPQLENYMFHARVKFSDKTSWFGVAFKHNGDFTKTTELRIYPTDNELQFYINGVQVMGPTIDLKGDHGFIFEDGYWHTIRVIVESVTVTNDRIQVYIDNEKITEIEDTVINHYGTAGLCHGAGTVMECDQFEIIPIPGQNIYVGLNGLVKK